MTYSDYLRSDMAKGVAIGAGVVVLVPLAAMILAPLARPLLREALKGGLRVYEKGRETLAELGETFEDVAAEVQAELREARLSEAAQDAAAPVSGGASE